MAQNHWDGSVGGTYISVFAGIDRHGDDGAVHDAAVAVFRYPGAHEIGIYHPGTGAMPLKITAARAGVLSLSDGHPHGLTFSVETHLFTATSAPTSRGCSPTFTTIPKSALRARIADVDGDGRPDTEWAALVTSGAIDWGVETASGAVIGLNSEYASGGERSVSIGRLSTGQVVALPSDGHFENLYVLQHCGWVTPSLIRHHSSSGNGFGYGYGAPTTEQGAGCLDGTLYDFDAAPLDGKTVTFSGRPVHIDRGDTTATLGPRRVFLRAGRNTTPLSTYSRYEGNTCAPSPRLAPRGHS